MFVCLFVCWNRTWNLLSQDTSELPMLDTDNFSSIEMAGNSARVGDWLYFYNLFTSHNYATPPFFVQISQVRYHSSLSSRLELSPLDVRVPQIPTEVWGACLLLFCLFVCLFVCLYVCTFVRLLDPTFTGILQRALERHHWDGQRLRLLEDARAGLLVSWSLYLSLLVSWSLGILVSQSLSLKGSQALSPGLPP